jgi:hypothetical protein
MHCERRIPVVRCEIWGVLTATLAPGESSTMFWGGMCSGYTGFSYLDGEYMVYLCMRMRGKRVGSRLRR